MSSAAEDARLKVSRLPTGEPEIFQSLQGEGVSLGVPSVFLRLATCNLACTWCDTKYTWDWRNYDYDSEVVELTQGQVEERVLSYDCRRLVVTGGEPLLQQAQLVPLVGFLKDNGFAVEIETNGTIAPTPELARNIDQWNVSPKLATSGNSRPRREPQGMLSHFSRLPNTYIKFVLVEPSDLDEVRALVEGYGLARDRVILMPEGRTQAALKERSRWLSVACAEGGYRFSPRLHIELWGDERGR